MSRPDSLTPDSDTSAAQLAPVAEDDAGSSGATRQAAYAMGQMIRRLHLKVGGSTVDVPALTQATQQLWTAIEQGDVCLSTTQLKDDVLAGLLRSPLLAQVGTTVDAGNLVQVQSWPLVLAQKRLYSWRYWHAEQSLATQLLHRASSPAGGAPDEPGDESGFDAFAGATPGTAQRHAVNLARHGHLLILTGGPGTGKTFTLAAVVRAAVRRALNNPLKPEDAVRETGSVRPPFTIAVAAPTGKATARLSGAIGPAVAEIQRGAGELTEAPDAAADRVQLRAMTMHRMLGLNAGPQEKNARLPYDLIVIDECSMVDALMAHSLFSRLADDAVVVLAGDRDQLASVEAGAFFHGVCTSGQPALAARRVVLDQNYRQKEAPEIIEWADAVRNGTLSQASMPAAGQQVIFDTGGPAALLDRAAQRLVPLVNQAGRVDLAEAAALYDAFLACQILSLRRAGPAGVDAINREMSARLGPGATGSAGALWYAGRLVVVRRNSPALGLFNGDIGLCVNLTHAKDEPPMLMVVVPDAGEAGGFRQVLPAQMPVHEDAWALTVHQAQGSDFEEVLLMPAPPDHRLATREGLYTALTRARRRIRVYAAPQDLISAAQHPAERQSGLLELLNAAQPELP